MAGDIDVSVRLEGPFFDARFPAAVRQFEQEAQQVVANQIYADVLHILDRSIRNPTPYYETQITTERVGGDVVVHDRGIVYGPWLEGTSSRNQTTRFKGYSAFRKAARAVRPRVGELVASALARFVIRVGG